MGFVVSLLEVPKTAKTVISLGDEAVDQAKLTPELKRRYRESLEVSLLPMVDGKKPIVFHVLPLSDPQKDQVNIEALARGEVDGRLANVAMSAALCLSAFTHGVQRVANVPQVTAEGTVVADLDPEHWGKLPLPMRQEIGSYVLQLSHEPQDVEPKHDVGK